MAVMPPSVSPSLSLKRLHTTSRMPTGGRSQNMACSTTPIDTCPVRRGLTRQFNYYFRSSSEYVCRNISSDAQPFVPQAHVNVSLSKQLCTQVNVNAGSPWCILLSSAWPQAQTTDKGATPPLSEQTLKKGKKSTEWKFQVCFV